jgi:hypothetical protein
LDNIKGRDLNNAISTLIKRYSIYNEELESGVQKDYKVKSNGILDNLTLHYLTKLLPGCCYVVGDLALIGTKIQV